MKTMLFCLCMAISSIISAQIIELQLCRVDSQYTQPGLYPSFDSLPCFDRGKCTTFSLQFVNPDSIIYSGLKVKVEYTIIEDITNLPCGIEWYASSWFFGTPYPIDNQGKTCFWLGGVTNDTVGLYKISLRATVALDFGFGPVEEMLDLGDYGYPLFLRVKDSADVCLAIDTSATLAISSCTSGSISCSNSEFGTICDTCSVISSVSEMDAIAPFHLHPNPATSLVTVSFMAPKSYPLRWQIVNTFGQVVTTAYFETVSGLNEETIDVSTLPTGVYLFMVNDGKQTINQRFVVGR